MHTWGLRGLPRGLHHRLLAATAVALLAGCGSSSGKPAAAPKSAAATSTPARKVIAPCYSSDVLATSGVLLSVPASEGQQAETISAVVTGTGDTGVVLAHQAGNTLCQWKDGQKELTTAGYRVISISMLRHDDADVAAAAAELRKRGAKHVILMGASRGGTASLAGAALVTPPVDAVVSLSGPGTSDNANADSVVPHLGMPMLFAAGTGDSPFIDDAKRMSASARPGLATLVTADSPAHGVDLYNTEDTVHQAVLDFLKKHSG